MDYFTYENNIPALDAGTRINIPAGSDLVCGSATGVALDERPMNSAMRAHIHAGNKRQPTGIAETEGERQLP